MKILSLKEGNMIKQIKNLFRLKDKELNYITIKDIKNLFSQKNTLKT